MFQIIWGSGEYIVTNLHPAPPTSVSQQGDRQTTWNLGWDILWHIYFIVDTHIWNRRDHINIPIVYSYTNWRSSTEWMEGLWIVNWRSGAEWSEERMLTTSRIPPVHEDEPWVLRCLNPVLDNNAWRPSMHCHTRPGHTWGAMPGCHPDIVSSLGPVLR